MAIMSAPAAPDAVESESPLHLMVKLLPWLWQSLLPVWSSCDVSRAGAFTGLRLGHVLVVVAGNQAVLSSFQSTLTALLWEQAACAHSSRAESRLPTVLLLGPQPSKQQSGFIFPLLDPDWICGSHPPPRTHLHLCYLFPWVPPRNTGLDCFFSSYSILYRSFLQPELYSYLYPSFWIVFCENCSICRCIFYLFMVSGEVYVLLFHYFDLYPYI